MSKNGTTRCALYTRCLKKWKIQTDREKKKQAAREEKERRRLP
jgi:hypothetical protein